ncbi:hypothetical protein Hanom_Chr03g00185741 [Helianthus anomalus]
MIRKRHIMVMFFTYLYTYDLYFFSMFSFVIYQIGGGVCLCINVVLSNNTL